MVRSLLVAWSDSIGDLYTHAGEYGKPTAPLAISSPPLGFSSPSEYAEERGWGPDRFS